MTEELFREDAYLKSCDAKIIAIGDDWIELDRTVFYPTGGGQPGDTGYLQDAGSGRWAVVDTAKSVTDGSSLI